MEFEGSEKEIDISELLFYVLYGWRKIIAISLIFIILCGGYRYITLMQILEDKETIAAQNNAYKEAAIKYENSKKLLEKDIKNIEDIIVKQNEYNENSILMQLDPFDVKQAYATFYIDTQYKINPELTYQNIDLSDRIIRSYISIAQYGNMYKYVIDNMSQDIELKYLKEILTVSADYETEIIVIKVIHSDSEICNEILNLVIECFNNASNNISNTIGEHTLSLIDNSSETCIDYELNTTQKNNLQLITTYENSIVEKQNALKALSAPAQDIISYSLVIKSTIKYVVLGFIIGLIISLAFITLGYIVNGKLHRVKCIHTLYHLRLLGIYEDEPKKRFGRCIDLLIKNLKSKKRMLKDEVTKRIAANVEAILEMENISNGCIMLTGTIDKAEIDRINNEISKELGPDYSFITGSDISYSADTINQLKDCNAVIIVEKTEHSNHNEIVKQLDNIKDLGKKVIGAIVITR